MQDCFVACIDLCVSFTVFDGLCAFVKCLITSAFVRFSFMLRLFIMHFVVVLPLSISADVVLLDLHCDACIRTRRACLLLVFILVFLARFTVYCIRLAWCAERAC